MSDIPIETVEQQQNGDFYANENAVNTPTSPTDGPPLPQWDESTDHPETLAETPLEMGMAAPIDEEAPELKQKAIKDYSSYFNLTPLASESSVQNGQEWEHEISEMRQPPFSLRAEQSVLGAILLNNEVIDQFASFLSSDDFYIRAHQVIYEIFQDMHDKEEPLDPLMISQRIKKKEAELESVGGSSIYLARLLHTVPSAANAKHYARIVHNYAIMRDLASNATSIVEDVFEGEKEIDEMLDIAEQRILSVAESKNIRRSEYYPLRSFVPQVLDNIEKLVKRSEKITGITTGFVDLDKMMAGLQPADLIILAARPSMGKTALAMNIGYNAAYYANAGVAMFSLEMSKEQLATRLLSSAGNINAQKLRTGDLDKGKDLKELGAVAVALSELPIFVDDTPALSITAMRAKARRLKREQDIKLILVDYLQLMRSGNNIENRVQEISEISRGLKAIAKEMNVPVVALSQLSRAVESRTDKRPILSDLRESGSIEQDADVVMFIFREEYYKPDEPSLHGLAELIVAKQRNGPVGKVMLSFLHEYTRFESYAEDPQS